MMSIILSLLALTTLLPYQNTNLTARERAIDLCSRLTLEEKALLMQDESPAIPRLGIKKFYWWSEALHGAANMGNVTVFPEPIGMAASFNPDLLYRVFDATSIELPRVQRAFLHALKAAGKTVIFVNCSGKLPVTFYKRTDQLPDFEDYSMRGRTYRYFSDALFPFGYGLSYTTFQIGNGQLTRQGDVISLAVPVSNTGRRDGSEVLQVYIRNTSDPDAPLKTLRAFQRVDLKAGQKKTIALQLSPMSFEFFDPETNTMRVKSGRYEVLYGTSSADQDLKSLTVDL